MTLDLLQVAHLVSFVGDDAGDFVRVLRILAEGVRFDGHRDHFILHVVFPEGCALGYLLERLARFVSGQDLVKVDRLDCRFGCKAAVPVVLLDVLDFESASYLCSLLDLLVKTHFETVRSSNLIVPPLIVHDLFESLLHFILSQFCSA